MDLFCGAPDPSDWSLDEAIQRALISEHAADATYQDILARCDNAQIRDVIAEIIKDEQNHQGRLQHVLFMLRGVPYESTFESGLKLSEPPQ